MKRWISMLLAVVLVLGMIPAPVHAEEEHVHTHEEHNHAQTASTTVVGSGSCGENLAWTLDENGILTISGTGEMYNYSRRAAPWYSAGVTVRYIVIEEGVTRVGNYAFSNDYGSVWLTVIPSTLTSIGIEAFMCGSRCVVINSETIAARATTYDSNSYLLFHTNSVLVKQGVSYGGYVLNGRAYTSGVEFKGVDYNVFSGCSKHAYERSNVLGNDMLICNQCDAVRDFSNMEFDVSATEEDHVTARIYKSGNDAVLSLSGYGNIKTDELPWREYSSLFAHVEIDDRITSIPDNAFSGCSKLTDITLPNGITSIGYRVFSDCTKLTSVAVPESVTEIGRSAFAYCSSLGSITIPERVTNIYDYAFSGCTSLNTIVFNGDAPVIDKNTFSGVTATAYYPINNDTWTEDVLQNYGGTLTWIPYGTCGAKLTWTLDSEGTLTISGTGSMSYGYSQNDVPWNDYRSEINKVVISEGVTSIGNYAFQSCNNLASVQLPNSLTDIYNYAFADCDSLESVTIPDGVSFISYNAFYDCDGLTSITIPGSVTWIRDYAFAYCSALETIIFTNAPKIDSYAFSGVTATAYYPPNHSAWTAEKQQNYGGALTWEVYDAVASGSCGLYLSWVLDDTGTLTIYGNGAMSDYYYSSPWYNYRDQIKNVVICKGVGDIGDFAFWGCNNLTGISIPTSVTYIGDRAFSNCSSLSGVKLPNGLTSLGDYAFYNCGSLSSIDIPDTVTRIDQYAFCGCDNLASVELSNKLTSLSDYLFYDCGKLTSVEIPDTVTEIGGHVFQSCTSLTSVTLGSNLTSIGAYAFSSCSSLANITFPQKLTSIGERAFDRCDSLTSITFPNKVRNIGSYAFSNCGAMDTIIFTGNAPAIEDGAFDEVVATVNYPGGNSTWSEAKRGNYGGTLTWNGIGNLVISGPCGKDLIWELSADGTMAISGTGPMDSYPFGMYYPWYELCSDVKHVVIEDGITCLPPYAFEGMTEIQAVRLPNTLEELPCNAFNTCRNLKDLIIPASVKAFVSGKYFNRCDALTDVYYMGTPEEWANVANNDVVGSQYDSVETIHFLVLTGQEATCTEPGIEPYYQFDDTSVYGGYYDAKKQPIPEPVIIPALGHAYGEWTETIKPTCTDAGEERRDCNNCDRFETRVVDAIGHDYESVVTDPTCTEQGYTTHTCANCGDSYITDEVEALGHNYHNGFCSTCDAYQPCEGNGTADSPYLIANAGNLYWFAAVVNSGYGDVEANLEAHAKLTTDIVINKDVLVDNTLASDVADFRMWTPIGSSNTTKFSGSFDGLNHTITGLYFNEDKSWAGLFGYSNGVVKNVGLCDSYINGGFWVGGIVGENHGIISGCFNTGLVIGNGSYTGGIVGYSTNGQIDNCYNTGDVTVHHQVGAYIGGIAGSSKYETISNCYNTGTIKNSWEGTGSNGSFTGGIVGYGSTVVDCHNAGKIRSNESQIGGIAGAISVNITNCYNTGDIINKNQTFVAGIVARNYGSIVNCYNTGDVLGSSYVGGIAALNYRDGNKKGTIINCYNIGQITGESTKGSIAGRQDGTVINCYRLSAQEGDEYDGVTPKTAEQFASGEVAYLLYNGSDGDIWGQNIDGEGNLDAHPVLSGNMVYKGYRSCAEDATPVYTNDSTIATERLSHSFLATVVNPTCTEQGYTAHTCENCGYSYNDNYVNATGHKYETAFTNPTCTEQGYTTHTCTVCGHSYADSYVDATGHEFGEWTVTETATCTEDGQERRDCSNCDHYETRVVKATNHEYVTTVTYPTCTGQGYTTHICSKCGDSYVDTYVPATGHSFDTWVVTEPAACTSDGQERRECQNCDHYETRPIAAIGHNYDSVATPPTCTKLGYTNHTCVNCGHSYVDTYVPANGHSFGDWFVVRDAACTTEGTEQRECQNCEHYETRTIEATGHNYKAVVTDPTCTEQGYTTHTCADCAHSFVDSYVNATGHSYGAWRTLREATCTQPGLEQRNCQNCSHYETREILATGHNYKSVVTEPTCTECGYTTHTCSECGHSYVDSYVDATGHKFDDWVVVNNATCTKDGLEQRDCQNCDRYETRTIEATGHNYKSVVTAPTCTEQGYTTHSCSNCGHSFVDSYVPATGHKFGNWTVIKAATCTEDGTERRDCQNCDHYETRTIGATGHSYKSVVTAPTCTEKGYTTHTCSKCGHSYIDSYVNATGHKFGSWVVTKAATCTGDGTERRDCNNCDHYETRTIAATGHNYKSVVTPPTCTEQGYTTHICSKCGHSYIDSYVDATGHKFENWVVTKAATCTEDGSERRDCDNCDHYETRAIKATGHSYRSVVTAPTCTEQGYTTHTCSKCGESYVDTYVPALGHSYGEWYQTKAPTYESEGEERRDCTRCDEFQTRVIPILKHEYVSVVTEPTCTEQGYTTHTCTKCGDTYVDTYVPALGHNFVTYVSDGNATCTEDGTKTAQCERCDETDTMIDHGSATGHSYNSVITEPTCTERGYTTHTCANCGDCYLDTYVAALGHNYGEWYQIKAPTYEAEGEERRDCTRCDEYQTRVIPMLKHEYVSVVTEPTCTEQGYTTHTCTKCGDTYVDTYVPALGHNFVTYVSDGNATCTEDGTKTAKCERCDETDTVIDHGSATGHEFGNWTVTKAATCTENGSERRDCANCDHYETRTIEATGHDYKSVVTAPTCTEKGYTTHTCTVCGHSYIDSYVNAAGHKFGSWIVIKEATCTEDGTEQRDCQNCEYCETRSIPATGHDYKSVATAPTCTEQGYTTHTCANCGHSYIDSYVNATGHKFGPWEVVTEPEAGNPGLKQRVCETCDHIETEEIPALDIVHGDTNGDGQINGKDLILLRQALAGWDVALDEAAADCNGDGTLNGKDLILLRQKLAGWDVTLG